MTCPSCGSLDTHTIRGARRFRSRRHGRARFRWYVWMTMSGPQWFSGDTDIFGGGNREKVWRIADAALATKEPQR